jgi:hypothetical protein
VDASTFSLGVEIFADWQNGQAVGVGSGFVVSFMRGQRQLRRGPSLR